MSITNKSPIIKTEFIILLFLKLRAIELISVVSIGIVFDVIHQLRTGIFPSIPVAVFMVPLGLYVGFGYFFVVAFVFLLLAVFCLVNNMAALLLANTLPLAVYGFFIFHSIFDKENPIWLICIWLATVFINAISVLMIRKTVPGSHTPV